MFFRAPARNAGWMGCENGRAESKASVTIYSVDKGDTLWNIAKRFGSTVDDIVRTNGIENPDNIQIGQKIYIPKYNRAIQKVNYA